MHGFGNVIRYAFASHDGYGMADYLCRFLVNNAGAGPIAYGLLRHDLTYTANAGDIVIAHPVDNSGEGRMVTGHVRTVKCGCHRGILFCKGNHLSA